MTTDKRLDDLMKIVTSRGEKPEVRAAALEAYGRIASAEATRSGMFRIAQCLHGIG